MPQQPNDWLLNAFQGYALLLSLIVFVGFSASQVLRPLKLRSRKPVPWSAVGGVLAGVFVFLALASAFEGHTRQTHTRANAIAKSDKEQLSEKFDGEDKSISVVQQITSATLVQLLLVCGSVAAIAITFRATRSDLGLPANRAEFSSDVILGVVAGFGAIAPAMTIRLAVIWVVGGSQSESGNPLIMMLREDESSFLLLSVASFAAVVAAPICEELTFRLLLQGWLEKCEAWSLRRESPAHATETSGLTPTEENAAATDEAQHVSAIVMTGSSPEETEPFTAGWGGMPAGLGPIMISSLFFALAHFGYGLDPIPLLFFAMVLGYLYYRTHRIVPCIAAHATFNSFTLIVIWLAKIRGVPIQ